jgi:hypothetical protein
MVAWAVAPAFARLMMEGVTLMLRLVIGAGMKIGYDLLLWRAFRHVKPPKEFRWGKARASRGAWRAMVR